MWSSEKLRLADVPRVVSTAVRDDAYTIWRDVGIMLDRAAALARDTAIPWPQRGRAADLCRSLSFQLPTDEALCSACMRSAAACREVFPVVQDLVIAAVELAPEPERVVTPLVRLCAAAHTAGHHATVVVALVALAELAEFHGDIPAAWFFDTRGLEHEAGYWVRRLVRRWVARFGGKNEGVRSVIRERQDELFLEQWMPIRGVLRLHAAEPTAAGWTALARRRQELTPGPLPLSFGDRTDDAAATLREALARRQDPGAHVALEGWLAELAQ